MQLKGRKGFIVLNLKKNILLNWFPGQKKMLTSEHNKCRIKKFLNFNLLNISWLSVVDAIFSSLWLKVRIYKNFEKPNAFIIILLPVKWCWRLNWNFMLSGPARVKVARRTLMKSTPAIINLAWLWHHFHLALDGDRTHDHLIVSRVLYR